jgi:hypothetical protein
MVQVVHCLHPGWQSMHMTCPLFCRWYSLEIHEQALQCQQGAAPHIIFVCFVLGRAAAPLLPPCAVGSARGHGQVMMRVVRR